MAFAAVKALLVMCTSTISVTLAQWNSLYVILNSILPAIFLQLMTISDWCQSSDGNEDGRLKKMYGLARGYGRHHDMSNK